MPKFTYKSNCHSKSLFLPFATDTNNCATRADAIKFMRNLEQDCHNDKRNHIIKK